MLGYRITAHNGGSATADDVIVTDTLSDTVAFISATPSAGTCTHAHAVLTCRLGDIAPATSVTIALNVRVLVPGKLINMASVTGANVVTPGGSIVASATTPVGTRPTRLTVIKRAASASVDAGHTIAYTIVVRNAGSNAAVRVQTCERLPAGLTYVSAPGSRMQAGNVCWTRAYLAPGASVRYHLLARVRPSTTGDVVNVVVARAQNAPRVAASAPVEVIGGGVRPGSGGVTG